MTLIAIMIRVIGVVSINSARRFRWSELQMYSVQFACVEKSFDADFAAGLVRLVADWELHLHSPCEG